MPDDHRDQPDKVWDEYDWERFLQEQDRKTEKYMELLERYIDDPNRDQIIAREMGWNHLANKEGQEWADKVDSQFSDEIESEQEPDPEDQETAEGLFDAFEKHPLYQAAFVLNTCIDQVFDECGAVLENHAEAVKLLSYVQTSKAKLASALGDDDIDEIGMTIAYLKRALASLNLAIECALKLRADQVINGDQYGALNQRLFQVRDGIIELMGERRSEWRRRYGS